MLLMLAEDITGSSGKKVLKELQCPVQTVNYGLWTQPLSYKNLDSPHFNSTSWRSNG